MFGGGGGVGSAGKNNKANGSPAKYTMGGGSSPTDSAGNNSPASGGKPRWQKAAAALAKTRRLYREWLNMDDNLLGDDN